MVDPHSSVSMKCDNEIESVKSRKGKCPLENNEDEQAREASKKNMEEEELGLAHDDFPLAPPDLQGREIKNENDDLGLVAAPQLENQDDLNMSSLFHGIGRDPSIRSLICLPRYNYACIASLNRSFRELIRSGELYKLRSISQVVEHWVYFACDHEVKWEAFDPICMKWMNLPMMDADICFQLADKESMAVGTELLVLGSDILGPGIYKYSLLTNSWSPGLPMDAPRVLFGSASFKNIAIFAGGVDRSSKIVDTVESYNSETGTWSTLPSLLKPRKLSSGVFMDGKFYVVGGFSGHDTNPLTCGEEYDMESQMWTEIPNMSPGGGGRSMAPPLLAVAANELYVANCAALELKMYNKKKKEWVVIGSLPETANTKDGWGVSFRGCGDRVLIICGPRAPGNSYIEIYSWVPKEGPPQWTRIGSKSGKSLVTNCAIMGC